MKALQIRRRVVRIGMARMIAAASPRSGVDIGPLEYRTIDEPDLPGPGWQRVRTRLSGICGSDLALVRGQASAYFDDWVSFPFVPGHEVVGELQDGTRVVLEPVMGHCARGVQAPWEGASPADGDDYAHLVTAGEAVDLEPGIQIGFCASTGGGWSPGFVAHESQLHPIPDSMSDETAVLIEPLASGIHAALRTLPAVQRALTAGEQPIIAVRGAGTMGLSTVIGLARYLPDALIVVGARYRHQQELARSFGAHTVVADTELGRAIRRITGSHLIGTALSGGAHATVDAVGTAPSLADSLAITRPRGRVVVLGMPAEVTLDLTGLWHRETELVGAYTYGSETLIDGRGCTSFQLAIETAAEVPLETMLSARYRLEEYRDALAHAAQAGRRGAIKIAFDLRPLDQRAPDPRHGVQ